MGCRHDICRNLIRVWVQKYEAGAFDEDNQTADLLQQYEARIAALERLVGKCLACAVIVDPPTPPATQRQPAWRRR